MIFAGGEFKPNNSITRAEFATVIAKYKKLDVSAGKALPFSDTAGHWAAGYLSAVYEKGYIAGYEDGTFRPDVKITRAEAVAMINRALDRIPDQAKINANLSKYPMPFTDVANTHWAYYDILVSAIDHRGVRGTGLLTPFTPKTMSLYLSILNLNNDELTPRAPGAGCL